MPTDPDYATWLTKQQAATALGVSPKQVERLANAGKLQAFLWKRPSGGQRLVVYAPDDVARVAHENRPSQPYVVPPTATPENGNGHAMQRQTDRQDRQTDPAVASNSALLQAISVMSQHMSEQSEQSQTLFLTIPAAAKFTGLSEAYIRRACQERRLEALKDGGWKIRRTALAAL